MKKLICLVMAAACLLAGCAAKQEQKEPEAPAEMQSLSEMVQAQQTQEQPAEQPAEEPEIPEEEGIPDETEAAGMPDEITDSEPAEEDDEAEEIPDASAEEEETDISLNSEADILQSADEPELPQMNSFENAGNGFVMPSFMKPYLEDNADNREEKAGTASSGNSIPLPSIDMSVLAGLESGGRHRFDEETETERSERVRVKPVKFVEPEELAEEPDDDPDFDEDDSPVFESRRTVRKTRKTSKERTAGKDRGTSKNKRKDEQGEKSRPSVKGSEKRKGGFFGKVGKALSRMLLIEAEEEDESYDDEDDEF